jgi:hypothetical protein
MQIIKAISIPAIDSSGIVFILWLFSFNSKNLKSRQTIECCVLTIFAALYICSGERRLCCQKNEDRADLNPYRKIIVRAALPFPEPRILSHFSALFKV